ncbi:hypothetical protein O7598_12715 [Micromonospora sp. WMMC241]|uniref:hypothetical protein n=1 Tax=Micromonospora sp. WMMC241 TaxID=3015159 RepID=UPI0022B6CA8F|nr:hypothetical protein [Micromonospora sp. WMMC241]MCZ7437262.1 hypothetical protein [Micromonospora sp. WMMC241]
MRLSRIIMALTVGLAVAAAPTAAGAAQPQPPVYPPTTVRLDLLNPTIFEGQTFTLRGRGFGPNELVSIHVSRTNLPIAAPAEGTARRSDGSTVAMSTVAYIPNAAPQPAPTDFTVRADANGNFTTTYRPTRTGRYTFTATGQTTGRTASTTGTVLPKRPPHPPRPPHHGGHLPVTGGSIGTPLKLGGGLAGAGAVLLLASLAWRRRRLG